MACVYYVSNELNRSFKVYINHIKQSCNKYIDVLINSNDLSLSAPYAGSIIHLPNDDFLLHPLVWYMLTYTLNVGW